MQRISIIHTTTARHSWLRGGVIGQRMHQRAFSASASASAAAAAAVPASPPLPPIQVLRLDHLRLPIRTQLQIEEALLRCKHPSVSGRSFFVLNQPPPSEKAVVMGLSNKTELLVHLDAVERDRVQLVRRFSGGGTVFVDQQCWMATMLIHKAAEGTALPEGMVHPSTLPAYPNTLMDWTRDFYAPVFGAAATASGTGPTEASLSSTTPDAATAAVDPTVAAAGTSAPPPPFSLTGHDYCFASRKFGGNAQTITRDRWLHHTSFLWTLDSLPRIEQYLRNPAKQPAYRAQRSHSQFLTSLREVWAQVEADRASRLASGAAGSAAEPSALLLSQFDQSNALSSHPLFNPPWDGSSDMSTSDVSIPSSLPARILWRLSHFYTLEYPTLDEVADIVEQYAREATSSVKLLDYEAERQREIQAAADAKAKEEAKIAAAVAAAVAST